MSRTSHQTSAVNVDEPIEAPGYGRAWANADEIDSFERFVADLAVT